MIEFNEDVVLPQVGTLKIKYYGSLQEVQEIDYNSDAITVDGNIVTIDPPADLEDFETRFWVQIVDNTIEDLVGNTFAGILAFNRDDWDFTTTSKLPQTISLDEIPDKTFGDDPFALTATASSGLAVEYSLLSGPAVLSGNEVTITGTGMVTIAANQPGDDDYSPAPEVTQAFTVNKGSQSISFDTIADKIFGDDPFEINASASSGLDVTYSVVSGPVSISGATLTIIGAGVATIAANQAGDENYLAASEVTRSFTIEKADQVISIDPISDKLTTDDPFDVSASVNSGLALTYQVSGPANISGTTVTLDGSVGTVTITVDQVGNENYNSASTSVSFGVNLSAKLDQTISFEPLADKTFGDAPVELTASASSGLGVQYSVISGPVSISGTTVTIDGAGEAVIAANQPGDDDYNAATEVTRSFTIEKADQVISFEAIADKTFGDDAFDLVATSSSGLSVELSVVSGSVAIDGTSVSIEGAGEVVIAANQAGNENYDAAIEVTRSFTVAKADQVITIEPITDKLTTDNSFNVSATVDSGLELTYEILGPASIDGTTITLDATAGTVTITVSQAGNENYNSAAQEVSFEVSEEQALFVESELGAIKFYPNPVIDFLVVESNEKMQIRLFNLQGRMVKQRLSPTGRLDLRDLIPGVYLLEIRNETQKIQKRIVKAN